MDVNEAEKEYRWLDAARSYEKILSSKSNNLRFTAESWQKIGFCYGLASNQAEDLEEFKKLRQLAIEAYETAAKCFAEDSSLNSQGKSAECLSIAEYIRSWLESNSVKKEKILDKCYTLGRRALDLFKKVDDKLSYGEICNVLSRCLFDRLYTAADEDEKIKFAQEGIEFSEEE